MILKLVHKDTKEEFGKEEKCLDGEKEKIYKLVQVFNNIKSYSTHQTITEQRQINYLLSFTVSDDLGGYTETLNLMDYDEVYVMNDNGKTIDTIRRCNY